jgi:hypothetical protein
MDQLLKQEAFPDPAVAVEARDGAGRDPAVDDPDARRCLADEVADPERTTVRTGGLRLRAWLRFWLRTRRYKAAIYLDTRPESGPDGFQHWIIHRSGPSARH